MAMRDHVAPGQYYTADYLRFSDLDGSRSFDSLFQLIRCRSKTAATPGVVSLTTEFGMPDTSPVYRVQSIHHDVRVKSWEFAADQTGTILLPAPPASERYVITYGSIRTEALSGQAYIHANGEKLFLAYFSSFTSFAAGNLYVPMEQGQSVKLTSTQGAKNLYVGLNYYIETVEAV